MSLLKTVREVINICRNPVQLTKYTWAELTALDTRIDDVEAGTVAEGSIDTSELADKAVTTDKIDDEAVDTAQIADDAVNTDKIPIFVSAEQTGTGEAQSIAHGLGVEPSTVMILFSSVGTDGATYTYTKGSANVNVTATTGAKYYVVAIA